MNGIIWWFNVAPLSFVFGVWAMLEWMHDNSWIGVSGNDIFAIGCLMGAVVSGIQIVIQRSGLLARNYNAEDIQLEEYLPEGWGIEKSYDPVALVGLQVAHGCISCFGSHGTSVTSRGSYHP